MLCSKAIAEGKIGLLISRGVTADLFTQDDPGREVAKIFQWAVDYSRRYGSCPSAAFIQHHFPLWRGEWNQEPVEALLDEFLAEVDRRYFEAKVIELSQMPKEDPDYMTKRGHLGEVLLDAARELSARIPSGRVVRFSDDFEMRIEAYEDEKGRYRPGIPLGLPVIDQTMGGIKSGWLVTYAGFSGIGKSILASHSLLSAFEDDKTALMLSAEMSSNEVVERLDTMVMHWAHRDYIRRNLSEVQVKHWHDVARVYSQAKGEIIVLDKFGGASLDRVHAEIERYKPDVTCIDYVQRLQTSSRRPKWEQLEEITNELKTIAMDTDTAIIMVSQDGRDSAEKGSTATNMGGSISVYQAADAYLGMMRDESMMAQNKMRVKLLKFRHGPLVEVDLVWNPAVGDFGRAFKDSDQFTRAPA